MPKVALPAHFDGERICLDEKYDLKPNTKLIVTVLTEEEYDEDREAWGYIADNSLENAYGDDDPDYSANMIKEPNPSYESR